MNINQNQLAIEVNNMMRALEERTLPFALQGGSNTPKKHPQHILAIDARYFEPVSQYGRTNFLDAVNDYPTEVFFKEAQSHIVIREREHLDNCYNPPQWDEDWGDERPVDYRGDRRYLQLLPYLLARQEQPNPTGVPDATETIFFPYGRTDKGGESRLFGKVSAAYGGHGDLADVVFDPKTSVIDLASTVKSCIMREAAEELHILNEHGQPLDIAEFSGLFEFANKFILDKSDDAGNLHVAVVVYLNLPIGYSLSIKEVKELVGLPPATALDILGYPNADPDVAPSPTYDLESWTRLLLRDYIRTELNLATLFTPQQIEALELAPNKDRGAVTMFADHCAMPGFEIKYPAFLYRHTVGDNFGELSVREVLERVASTPHEVVEQHVQLLDKLTAAGSDVSDWQEVPKVTRSAVVRADDRPVPPVEELEAEVDSLLEGLANAPTTEESRSPAGQPASQADNTPKTHKEMIDNFLAQDTEQGGPTVGEKSWGNPGKVVAFHGAFSDPSARHPQANATTPVFKTDDLMFMLDDLGRPSALFEIDPFRRSDETAGTFIGRVFMTLAEISEVRGYDTHEARHALFTEALRSVVEQIRVDQNDGTGVAQFLIDVQAVQEDENGHPYSVIDAVFYYFQTAYVFAIDSTKFPNGVSPAGYDESLHAAWAIRHNTEVLLDPSIGREIIDVNKASALTAATETAVSVNGEPVAASVWAKIEAFLGLEVTQMFVEAGPAAIAAMVAPDLSMQHPDLFFDGHEVQTSLTPQSRTVGMVIDVLMKRFIAEEKSV